MIGRWWIYRQYSTNLHLGEKFTTHYFRIPPQPECPQYSHPDAPDPSSTRTMSHAFPRRKSVCYLAYALGQSPAEQSATYSTSSKRTWNALSHINSNDSQQSPFLSALLYCLSACWDAITYICQSLNAYTQSQNTICGSISSPHAATYLREELASNPQNHEGRDSAKLCLHLHLNSSIWSLMTTLTSYSCHRSWPGSLHPSRFIFRHIFTSQVVTPHTPMPIPCAFAIAVHPIHCPLNHTICPYLTSAPSITALSTSLYRWPCTPNRKITIRSTPLATRIIVASLDDRSSTRLN